MSEWAERYRYLSPEASSKPGRWKNSTTPYLVGIMDAISDPRNSEITFMSSSQVGKTEVLNNCAGYFMHQDPCPVLCMQPTLEMAQTWSKDRLSTMVRDSPVLRGLLKDPKSRSSNNTILHKQFPGGAITIVGANSPSGLASRPIRIVLPDEIDRYPISAGAEGDPLAIAEARTTTFWNRKLVKTSTPTVAGASRIEMDWLRSDQRRYFVPCPHCKHYQHLVWGRIKWTEFNLEPKDAVYQCESCEGKIPNSLKKWMLDRGEWEITNPEGDHPGFHVWTAYSPWKTFGDIAVDFLKKKKHPELFKTFVNTVLGESWTDPASEKLEYAQLLARAEPYKPLTCPSGVRLLTAGVDVQKDRLAVVVRGWGVGEESWLIYWIELYGLYSTPEPWTQLSEFLNNEFEHENGGKLKIKRCLIDSSGYTQDVYNYVRTASRTLPVVAGKGMSISGKPVINRPTAQDVTWQGKTIKGGIKMWPLGVDTAKDVIHARLRLPPGQGAYHTPIGTPEDYYKQLCGEIKVTKYLHGFPKQVWEKLPNERNEALDCEVYALAAAISLGIQLPSWNWTKFEADTLPPPGDPEPGPPEPPLGQTEFTLDSVTKGKKRDRPPSGKGQWMKPSKKGWMNR